MEDNNLVSENADLNIQDNQKEKKSFFNGWTIFLIVYLLLFGFLILFNTVFINTEVIGSSMEPTLYEGEVLVVNTKANSINRGDIIVIKDVKSYWIIKRVIAIEGDTVKIENGKVYLNGEVVEEPYLSEGTVTTGEGFTQKTLTENEIFYLGDNRQVSLDARVNGVCLKENVVGVVSDFSVKCKKVTTVLSKISRFLVNLVSCNGENK